MPSSKSTVIIACAGSGKTTRLVEEALADPNRRIAIISYTNRNTREISERFGKRNSGVPTHVDVMTWFGFLLRECARPYQRSKYAEKRIESIQFVSQGSAKFVKETDVKHHYFANGELIYSDKIAKFVVDCEAKSANAITARLREVYTDLFIDEFQDLAGWDLEVIKLLLRSGIRIILVGDPRQHIYSTNPSSKNKQYLGIQVVPLIREWSQNGLCTLEAMSVTHRCNQEICDFANALWPGLDSMTPSRNDATDHDGVFLVGKDAVAEYIGRFQPQVLRHDRRAGTSIREVLNFGLAKGLQFERVLVVPTDPIKRYLKSGDLHHVEKSKDKLHVAVTRAFHSVAFLYDGSSAVVRNRWAAPDFEKPQIQKSAG